MIGGVGNKVKSGLHVRWVKSANETERDRKLSNVTLKIKLEKSNVSEVINNIGSHTFRYTSSA